MEGKALSEQLGSLDIEKIALQAFQPDIKALQMKEKGQTLDKLCQRKNQKAEGQDKLQLKVSLILTLQTIIACLYVSHRQA